MAWCVCTVQTPDVRVLWQRRLNYEVDIREEGATSGKRSTFIALFPSTTGLCPLPSLISSASHGTPQPFGVNSLIRKTLTCVFHPLFLFILVGKYFIDFCSNRRRMELRVALCGIRLCRGFSGLGGLLVKLRVCVSGAMSFF